ncbi:MAG: hypothetical protein KatS3mg008_0924 [Acidimicrobiales bacterium]|nr:MAG: hypothetical protein KatS3mg008_0924 [Acidimicrobiales bacterium]
MVGNSVDVGLIEGLRPVECGNRSSCFELDDAVVLMRHGEPYRPAHLVDHKQNVRLLCALGCDRVIGFASVGSLRADIPPGTVVVPDDFFAPWSTPSFYEDRRGHSSAGFHTPFRNRVLEAIRDFSPSLFREGGVYAETRGPRFETPAEVRFLSQWAHVVGMTIASECVLCCEAGLAYAAVCSVDNYANGIAGELTLEAYEKSRADNLARTTELLVRIAESLVGGP